MLPELLNEQLRLNNGTIVKKCPTVKPLYCAKDGRFFSVRNMQITDEGCIMHEVQPIFSPAMRVRNQNSAVRHGINYPQMRHFGNRPCHHLIWETWVGPRTKGMEIDHLNGNILDWSLDNLEEVTPEENRKRAVLLRELRRNGRDPKQMTRDQLQAIFRKYRLGDPNARMDLDFSRHREF